MIQSWKVCRRSCPRDQCSSPDSYGGVGDDGDGCHGCGQPGAPAPLQGQVYCVYTLMVDYLKIKRFKMNLARNYKEAYKKITSCNTNDQ